MYSSLVGNVSIDYSPINQQGAGPMNLKCQYSGNPAASVGWYKDNEPLGKANALLSLLISRFSPICLLFIVCWCTWHHTH